MCKSKKEKLLKDFCNLDSKRTQLLEQMKKIHAKSPYTVGDSILKKSRVCFIFSCPGQEELKEGCVCAGKTGTNLEQLIALLKTNDLLKNSKNKAKLERIIDTVFNESSKTEYDILNASQIVHFEALDEYTEGSDEEIDQPENRDRIITYIDNNPNLQYIICFGLKSQQLIDTIKKENKKAIEIIEVSHHLSFRSLNQITTDIQQKDIMKSYKKPSERNSARLMVLAKEIIEQIDKRI